MRPRRNTLCPLLTVCQVHSCEQRSAWRLARRVLMSTAIPICRSCACHRALDLGTRHGATAGARRGRGAPAQLHMQLRAPCSAAAPAPSSLHLVQQLRTFEVAGGERGRLSENQSHCDTRRQPGFESLQCVDTPFGRVRAKAGLRPWNWFHFGHLG
jgi:hypothetical protein